MKKSLLIIFTFICLSSLAQSPIWTKGNAVWHYQFSNRHDMGFIKVWENGDTTLLGRQCTKLKAEKHSLMLAGPNAGNMVLITDYIGGAVYASNDTIYYWDTDHFSVLYNFSAQENEQWLLQTGGTPGFSCNDTSVCMVQFVGTITIDGQNYPELTLGNSSDAAFYLEGKVNTRFGSSEGYLLPLVRTCDTTENEWEDQISFVCFQDDSLFYNPTGQACYYSLDLNESEINKISVFPNPASDRITVYFDELISRVVFYNLIGEMCLKSELNQVSSDIDLSDLKTGIYMIEIHTASGKQFFRKIDVQR